LAESAKAKQYAEKDYEMSKMGIDSLYGKKGITEKVIATLMAGGIRNMTDLRKLGAPGIIRLVESPMAANSIKKHVGLI
jgi:hypothetical protein